jgi:potassium-transporting ATPase KdpC subunit
MSQHLRANLWLLLLSVLLGSIVYPAVLYGIGQTVFADRANGSIIIDKKTNQPVGSRLIAQPFTAAEYFQPRPSAAGYNGAASGASNWGANNPLLRARVAQALGPIVKYGSKSSRRGEPVGPDIEAWFQNWSEQHANEPLGVVAKWAELYPSVAVAWAKGNAAYVEEWQKEHADAVAQFKKEHPEIEELKPEDMTAEFFKSYSSEHPGTWPVLAGAERETEKTPQSVREGSDIQAYFFDMWRQEHPDDDLEEVPADMVMASGSGLDPHITLKNALYQLDRVAAAWAEKTTKDQSQVRKEIEQLLNDKAEAPLGGLVGVKLINVLEINLALRDRYGA